MMIFGVFCMSILMSQVILIMSRESEMTMAFDEQMKKVCTFMQSRDVPKHMQTRIRRYFEDQFKMQRGQAGSDRVFMDHLSEWLRIELTEHLNRTVFERHPFFRKLPREIFRRICLMASPLFYTPGDFVVEVHHIAMSAHFLVKGKLRVHNVLNAQLGDRSIYLQPPCWIGDKCLFMDVRRTHTVSAVTPSETLCLQKSCLVDVVDEYPVMTLKYESVRAKLIQGDDSELRCTMCNSPGHAQEDCPKRGIATTTEVVQKFSWLQAQFYKVKDQWRKSQEAPLSDM
jgi:CRP-like cAMP-binding protein